MLHIIIYVHFFFYNAVNKTKLNIKKIPLENAH